jgi:hypothetical protein
LYVVPAALTTFSSIITLPMSLAPKNSANCPIFGPIVTHELCSDGMLSKNSRAIPSIRRYSSAPAIRTTRPRRMSSFDASSKGPWTPGSHSCARPSGVFSRWNGQWMKAV